MRVLFLAALLAPLAVGQSSQAVRKAIERALIPLQRSASVFADQRACFSCHHNTLPILTLHMARDRGITIDTAVLSKVEQKTWASGGRLEDVVDARNLSNPAVNDTLLLLAQEFAGVSDAAAVARARLVAAWQQEDGHWFTSDFRPPHSFSAFAVTATTVRALRAHLHWNPDHQRVLTARRWLFTNKPASTEDAAFRLMGLVWAGGSQDEIAGASRDLRLMQRPNGGWGQTPAYAPDAYSTGEAVFALREAGEDNPKGIKFLLSSQARDGTWRTRTRMVSPAVVSPPYFTTGFPYKQDEYLSFAGTCWAVMALLSTLPGRELAPLPSVAEAPPAAAGTPFAQLTRAVAHRDAAEVRRLLDAGALPDPPEGQRVRNTPLRLAAMAGDLELVRLLLGRGAAPDEAALSEAITFGHSAVVQVLMEAGTSPEGVDRTGINLLHWAAITGRAEVVPLLAKAGVDLDAIDDNGFTPLMYAAALDYGDTRTLQALLAAGADVEIRDFKNRSALDYARRFKHAAHAALLRSKGAR